MAVKGTRVSSQYRPMCSVFYDVPHTSCHMCLGCRTRVGEVVTRVLGCRRRGIDVEASTQHMRYRRYASCFWIQNRTIVVKGIDMLTNTDRFYWFVQVTTSDWDSGDLFLIT